jgi:hypothetical protein
MALHLMNPGALADSDSFDETHEIDADIDDEYTDDPEENSG